MVINDNILHRHHGIPEKTVYSDDLKPVFHPVTTVQNRGFYSQSQENYFIVYYYL